MANKIRVLFLVLFYFVNLSVLQSQDTAPNPNFFNSKMIDYRNWLQNTNLGTILNTDTVTVHSEKVILMLTIRDQHNWERLVRLTDSVYGISVAATLFNHFVFDMDLSVENAEIDIDAIDATIKIQNRRGEINTSIWKKMGEPSDNVNLPMEGLRDISNLNTFSSKKSIDELKLDLQKGLETYFRKFKAKVEDYHFVVMYALDNNLILDVSNIVDAVLKEGYFEHLQFNFTFGRQADKITVKYEYFGKYAGGILWAPQDSRYKNMTPKYSEQLRQFNLVISNEIGKIVK